MARRSRDPPQVDLAQFSAGECAKIWEVLQKDFHLRFREEQRLQRLRSQLAKAGSKATTLGSDADFNEKYCIICFRAFWLLFNPRERCLVCLCYACRSCSRFLQPHERWLCRLCEEEKTFAAKQCLWFYDGTTKRFVVGGNPSPIAPPAAGDENGDPLADQLRRYLQEFVTRIKQDSEEPAFEERTAPDAARRNFSSMPPRAARGPLPEAALKRITAHQVMRFHQRIAEVSSDVERFLRSDVRYEIPEAGVDVSYDQNMEAFRKSVASILRNFSQSLYIAIEGHHSKTGEPVEDVHLGVQQILQDEVESLVGCRVDIPNDDDAASIVSDDVGRSNDQGLTIHDRLADCLLSKLLNDHQTYLDDQHLTASDMYAETALERVLAQKGERRLFGELPDGPFGEEVDPDLLSAGGPARLAPRGLDSRDVAQKTIRLEGSISSSSGSGANWLLAGRPTAKCSDSLRGFGAKNEPSEDFSDVAWKDLGDLDDESDDNMSSLSSNLGAAFPARPITDRKISTASLDFDDVYRRNLTFTKDSETSKEKLEQSSRSEDSGVHVTGSSPPTLDRKSSLGFSRMDWSFNERSDPHFVAKPERVVVEAGECAVIEVAADGTLPIDVFWHRCRGKEPHQLAEEGRVEFLVAPDHPGRSSLLLWDARKEDAGEYLATAVNANGSTQQGFKIQVTDRKSRPKPPEFLQEVSDEFVREGDTARLFCKVQGRPKPRVQFLKDGAPLRSSEKSKIMTIGQRSVSLTIFDVRPEDQGSYVCLATNCGGTARCEAQVKISTSGYRLIRHYLYYTDPAPAVDNSPAVKVKTQVSRLSNQTSTPACSVDGQLIRSSSGGKHMSEPKIRDDRRLRREGPKATLSEIKRGGNQPVDKASRVLKRQDSSTRRSFKIPDTAAEKKREEEEGKRKREEEEEKERRERRERAERDRAEKERRAKEEKRMKETRREEERERELEERSRKIEQKRREREEKQVRERLERESKEWEERKEKDKEERERRKREEESLRRKEEEERAERRERREKERRLRERKERKEREERERVEKEEEERRVVEERIRLRRIEREKRELEEEERREQEEEEEMEAVLAAGVHASLPHEVQVDGETHFPHGGKRLQLSNRSLSPSRTAAVSDIKTLIESGKLQPAYAPNMKASFRTRKFPSVPEIRDQLSRRGAYGKRPDPVPVKITGKKPTFRKSEAAEDPCESNEDFRRVTLKSTGVNLEK